VETGEAFLYGLGLAALAWLFFRWDELPGTICGLICAGLALGLLIGGVAQLFGADVSW
jgi:hypothetical protein